MKFKISNKIISMQTLHKGYQNVIGERNKNFQAIKDRELLLVKRYIDLKNYCNLIKQRLLYMIEKKSE